MTTPREEALADLRQSIDALPERTRLAMLSGLGNNTVITGAFSDGSGVCPMLAAHRSGGRTSFASFAAAWDAFTGAGRRPRRASRREIRALRTYLEMSLLSDDTRIGGEDSLASIASQIRAERRAVAARRSEPESPRRPESGSARPGDPDRAAELGARSRWSWIRPTRRYDVYQATLAAASEQLSESRADAVLGEDDAMSAHRQPLQTR